MNGWRMRSRKKSKVPGNKWKWTYNSPKLMRHSKNSIEREVHNDTGLPKKDRNISNNQPNPTSTRTTGTTANIAKSK